MTILLLAASTAAGAQWLPQWIGVWEHDESFHGAFPIALRVAADGSVFASVDATHHNAAHAALMRFEADGTFAWMGERTAVVVADMALLEGDRIAFAGADAQVFVRVLDATSGDLAHDCTWDGAQLQYDERDQTRALAPGADGGVFVRARDGSDFVVLRCDANGQSLPEWRWSSGLAFVRADDILALPDGGVVVAGRGGTGEGYFSVRFAADGTPALLDSEAGEIGNPLGALHVAIDADGAFVFAAAPESTFGVPQAQVWKVAADGSRLWTRVIEVPGQIHPNLDIGGFALAPDGDVVIAVAPPSGPFRALRLANADGTIRWDSSAAIGTRPTGLALAPNGRVLVVGYASIPGSGGHITSRLAEFAADGTPCRQRIDFDLYTKLRVAAGDGGWNVLGATEFVQGIGNDAVVHRYDADGSCDGSGDAIFVDGFDGAEPG